MRVVISRDADVTVAKDAAHQLQIHTTGEQEGCRGMPQIVVADDWHASRHAALLERTHDVARKQRRTSVRGEDKVPWVTLPLRTCAALLLLCTLLLERVNGMWRQRQGAAALLRLRRQALPLAVHELELPAHHEHAALDVHVFPRQAKRFALPQAETEREREERPEPVVVRRDE